MRRANLTESYHVVIFYFLLQDSIFHLIKGFITQIHPVKEPRQNYSSRFYFETAPPTLFLDPDSRSGSEVFLYYLRTCMMKNKVSQKPDLDLSIYLVIIVFPFRQCSVLGPSDYLVAKLPPCPSIQTPPLIYLNGKPRLTISFQNLFHKKG